jgi:hypothetical protein
MEALALFASALTLAAIAKITPRLISTAMTTRAFSFGMDFSPSLTVCLVKWAF